MISRYLAGICAGIAFVLALFVVPAAVAAETKTIEVKGEVNGDEFLLTLQVPEDWKQKPGDRLRKAQFEVPAAEGDKDGGELVVFYFGKGSGGSVQDNIQRYTKQFDADERKLKILEGESQQGKYTLIELAGTYNKSIGPPIAMKTTKMAGARMLAVILHSEKYGNFFIRLTGPEKTVTANANAFRESFGADPKKEQERKADKPAEEKKE